MATGCSQSWMSSSNSLYSWLVISVALVCNLKTNLFIVVFGLRLSLDHLFFAVNAIQGIVVDDLVGTCFSLIFIFGGFFVLQLALLRASSLSARLAALSLCSRRIFLRIALLSFFISSAILGTSSRNAASAAAQYSTDPIVVGEFVVALASEYLVSAER